MTSVQVEKREIEVRLAESAVGFSGRAVFRAWRQGPGIRDGQEVLLQPFFTPAGGSRAERRL